MAIWLLIFMGVILFLMWLLTSWKFIAAVYVISVIYHFAVSLPSVLAHRKQTNNFHPWTFYLKDSFYPVFNTLAMVVDLFSRIWRK